MTDCIAVQYNPVSGQITGTVLCTHDNLPNAQHQIIVYDLEKNYYEYKVVNGNLVKQNAPELVGE
jgi:hypothetical protein